MINQKTFLRTMTLLGLLGLGLSFQSCVSSIVKSKVVELDPRQKRTTLEFQRVSSATTLYGARGRDTDSKVKPKGGDLYKIRNDAYLITQTAEGYRTMTTPIYPTKFNVLKAVDLGITVAGMAIILDTGGDIENEVLSNIVAYGTLASGYAVFSRPYTVYPKEVQLPRLQALPVARPTDPGLFVSQIEGDIESVNMNFVSYSSFKRLDKNKNPTNTTIAEEDVVFEDLIPEIKGDLNDKLSSYGFQGEKTDRLNNAQIFLKGGISALSFTQVGTCVMMDVTCNWELRNAYEEVILAETEKAKSSWAVFDFRNSDNTFRSLIVDALESSMIKFIDSEEFQNVITKYQEETNAKSTIADITIGASTATTSLPQAVKSVATITTENGHGSGVLVDESGYILTNYHVINQSDSIRVVFSETQTYTAKVDRSSRKYDLALLKVEGLDPALDAISITNERNTDVGLDVYAIGSPADVSLGQTLSKGIISGRRDFDGRTYLQTDVSINGGNSGGALINTDGQLLGIVNAKLVGVGVEGIGFAIPLDVLEDALNIKIK